MLRVWNFYQSSFKFTQLESSYAGASFFSMLLYWMGDGAARHCSAALPGAKPCRVITHHNKSYSFISVHLDTSWSRAVLFWWKYRWHCTATISHMSLLWTLRIHRNNTSRSCLVCTLRFITWLPGSNLSNMCFHSRWRSQPPPYLVGLFHTHQSGASLNGPKRPYIIFGRAITVWRWGPTRSTFSRRYTFNQKSTHENQTRLEEIEKLSNGSKC